MMLSNMCSSSAQGTEEAPINMDTDAANGKDPGTPPIDDNSLLSFSTGSFDNQANKNEDANDNTNYEQPDMSTLLIRYVGRDKRKLSLDDDISQDDTSRSTRATNSPPNDNDGKPSSSEGAETL